MFLRTFIFLLALRGSVCNVTTDRRLPVPALFAAARALFRPISPGPSPMTDPSEPLSDPFLDVRELIRRCDRAALATALPNASGQAPWPYASLVLVAVDHDLSPILLLSDLAEHTKAIAA